MRLTGEDLQWLAEADATLPECVACCGMDGERDELCATCLDET